MKYYLIIIIILISSHWINAQVIPDERIVNWSYAGYGGDIPVPELILNVTDYGATGDSTTDNYQAISDAIDALGGQLGYIYFPPGGYMINSTIHLPANVIILGATADSTELMFDLGGQAFNCFTISGNPQGEFTSIISGYNKGSFSIDMASTSTFETGDYAEIREENGDWDTNPVSWADYSVGQIVKISGKSGNTLFLAHPLRIDYESSLNPEIRKIDPIKNVGVECLKISRLDHPETGAGYNMFFDFAAQCWITGVESNRSVGSHIYIARSTNIEISGCYIHDAFTYEGAGTRGYGITLNHHAGECLIENNILRHLRHALMVKTGANGNVFGYNYSIEPYRTEPIHDFSGDISLHGHYAYCNLFEGNIVQNIIVDHYWGPSGPFNTLFRNRAELYGIILTDSDSTQTNNQNIVGNEVTNTTILYGQYFITGTGHFEYGNNVKGIIIPEGTDDLEDLSYYLSGEPEFWNVADEWPSIGIPNEIGTGDVPANIRYLLGPELTLCRDTGTSTPIDFNYALTKVKIWPNPIKDVINIELKCHDLIQIAVYDQHGKVVFKNHPSFPINNQQIIQIHHQFNTGIFLLQITTLEEVYTFKLIKL